MVAGVGVCSPQVGPRLYELARTCILGEDDRVLFSAFFPELSVVLEGLPPDVLVTPTPANALALARLHAGPDMP